MWCEAFLQLSVMEAKGDLSVKECEVSCQFQFTDERMVSLTILLPCVGVTERWNLCANAQIPDNRAAPVTESAGWLKALKEANSWSLMIANEFPGPWPPEMISGVWAEEAGSLYHRKSHKRMNVKQDVCSIISYRSTIYFYPLFDTWKQLQGIFEDSSLHFEIPPYYNQPLIRTTGQY